MKAFYNSNAFIHIGAVRTLGFTVGSDVSKRFKIVFHVHFYMHDNDDDDDDYVYDYDNDEDEWI